LTYTGDLKNYETFALPFNNQYVGSMQKVQISFQLNKGRLLQVSKFKNQSDMEGKSPMIG